MLVGSLAQAGGLSTIPRILILENHELVDGDWKEEAASKSLSTATGRRRLSQKQGTGRPGGERTHLWTI
jgi:hypothetical protein